VTDVTSSPSCYGPTSGTRWASWPAGHSMSQYGLRPPSPSTTRTGLKPTFGQNLEIADVVSVGVNSETPSAKNVRRKARSSAVVGRRTTRSPLIISPGTHSRCPVAYVPCRENHPESLRFPLTDEVTQTTWSGNGHPDLSRSVNPGEHEVYEVGPRHRPRLLDGEPRRRVCGPRVERGPELAGHVGGLVDDADCVACLPTP
jgi:hypothetical protein